MWFWSVTVTPAAYVDELKHKVLFSCYFYFALQEGESVNEAIKSTPYPRIVGSGELARLDPLLIVAEGKVVVKLVYTPMPMAISLLLGTFYVLNMEYTLGVRNVYAFLELVILDQHELAKKRITVMIDSFKIWLSHVTILIDGN